jgi:hypothetical protein
MNVLKTLEIASVSGGVIQNPEQEQGNLGGGRQGSPYDSVSLEVGATGCGSNSCYGSEPTGLENANACASGLIGAGGMGGAIAIGIAGVFTGGAAVAVAGLAGALVGGSIATGNSACGPSYK